MLLSGVTFPFVDTIISNKNNLGAFPGGSYHPLKSAVLPRGRHSFISESIFTARLVEKFKAEEKGQVNLTSGSNFSDLED